MIEDEIAAHDFAQEAALGATAKKDDYVTAEYLEEMQAEMLKAAQELDFERAAQLRDRISTLKGEATASPQGQKPKRKKKSNG